MQDQLTLNSLFTMYNDGTIGRRKENVNKNLLPSGSLIYITLVNLFTCTISFY